MNESKIKKEEEKWKYAFYKAANPKLQRTGSGK